MKRLRVLLLLCSLAGMSACVNMGDRKQDVDTRKSAALPCELSMDLRDQADRSDRTGQKISNPSNRPIESKSNEPLKTPMRFPSPASLVNSLLETLARKNTQVKRDADPIQNDLTNHRTYIVDGIWGNHVYWEPLRERLGDHCHIWHYDNSGKTPLSSLGADFAAELSACAQRGETVDFVGFSLGGMVVREALRLSPETNVRRVVFINSPHRGTAVAYLFPFLPACRDVKPGSDFLRRLNAVEWNHETLAIWCPADTSIVPGHSAKFKKATKFRCCHVPAHFWPIISRREHKAIASFLNE